MFIYDDAYYAVLEVFLVRLDDGLQQWFCLDQNNANVKTKPVYVAEDAGPAVEWRTDNIAAFTMRFCSS